MLRVSKGTPPEQRPDKRKNQMISATHGWLAVPAKVINRRYFNRLHSQTYAPPLIDYKGLFSTTANRLAPVQDLG
jgi:hypothetical protein